MLIPPGLFSNDIMRTLPNEIHVNCKDLMHVTAALPRSRGPGGVVTGPMVPQLEGDGENASRITSEKHKKPFVQTVQFSLEQKITAHSQLLPTSLREKQLLRLKRREAEI